MIGQSILPMMVIFVAGFAAIQTEKIPVECFFSENHNEDYSCGIIGATIENDVTLNFTIGGTHLPGKTNEDVRLVKIEFSSVPFIFKEIFETFPNVRRLNVLRGGLVTFQKNAFFKAEKLGMIDIQNNFLTTLYPHAFVGAINLEVLRMRDNSIHKIDEHALVGLNNLDFLDLSGNEIEEFPRHFFRPAIRLVALFANINKFSRLNGDMFERKYQIYQIDFPGNQINAIERSFMDNINVINQVNFMRNICVNGAFQAGTPELFDALNEALEPCFQNFENTLQA